MEPPFVESPFARFLGDNLPRGVVWQGSKIDVFVPEPQETVLKLSYLNHAVNELI
jgi:hypothetical protein